MSDQLPVLIVGAGPTGLMMACELARHGVSFRIIDKKSEPALGSNATWIHPRSLELFDDLGIIDAFLIRGHVCNAIHLHIREKELTRISLDDIDSIYNYVLMLSQSETEKILTERLEKLHHKIERSSELIEVKQKNDEVIAQVKHLNGETETINSQWLIACDGANSTVRQSCGIFFPGEDLTEQFMVADADMNSFMLDNEVHVFFDKGTVCGVFPMGGNKYRINANLHQSQPRMLFVEKEVREIIAERTFGSYNVNKVSWISPFWIHGKVVKNLRQGSIFLAGDAAHIHSPAGGQGMNTGFQDSYNLAWKLALVLNKHAKPSLLDSYQLERHPVVKDIVDQTDDLTKLALFNKRFLTKLRNFSNKVSRDELRMSKKIGRKLTQLDIKYQQSPIINYEEKVSKNAPSQGMRAPDVYIDESSRLYDYLHNTQHNILLFAGEKIEKKKLLTLDSLKQWLNKTYSNLVKTHIISSKKLENTIDVILDKDNVIHNQYQIKKPAIYIIRPDKYVAFYSKHLDKNVIEKFFQLYM